MYLEYFVVICVFAMKNIDGYSLNRQPRVTITDSIHVDDFPEVEYPSSIMDSTKPFFLNVSPFSSDVQSSFKSLVAGTAPTKPKKTIVLNLKSNESKKEKRPVTTEKVNPKPAIILTEKVNNSNEKVSNETIINSPIIINIVEQARGQGIEKEQIIIANETLPEQPNDNDEMEYVVTFIDDLDEYITALLDADTEFIDCTDPPKTIDVEHSNETVTITSDVTSENDDPITELNNDSLHAETSSLEDSEEVINQTADK